MTINIAGYFSEIQKIHASGKATEHSYRPALEKLFNSIADGVTCINEPVGMTRVGRPDFVFTRSAGIGADITVGHCEAKDIGISLAPKSMNEVNRAQYDRYVKALPNLIYTNGLDFRFYKKGELAREISIGEPLMGLQTRPDQFAVLANQLTDFASEKLQTITSAERLAEMMAGKASLIKDILGNALKEDKDLNTELTGQYISFRDQLIHDLTPEDFSDLYAETIAYGMFAARLHDETLQDFSREEALTLLPKSNPFLRNLFGYVAGPTLDERIKRPIDELAEIFQATDLSKLFEDFGKFTQRNDPFIHFYETFLAEYNPAKRKARGVWYTPEPVVNFIVRAVDDVLKSEFGLPLGLADTSKVTVNWDTGQTRTTKTGKAEPVTIKKEVHRVQILDPAAGTGTFLAEVIKQIAPKVKDVAEGQWSTYVKKELIPRLHGFELLMASYAMCHMKLDMMLTEMGYKPTGNPPRLGVYLTNSLEEGERANQTLPFAQWLSNEAKEANTIKRDMPIMCVIGNPPYSGHSSNRGEWINQLIETYKQSPDLKKPAQGKWLSDDYVKFIRFAQYLIEKNGEGVLGFITNHSYITNPTFKDMRQSLSTAFDVIYVCDLHGNAKKVEISPDGTPDKNVFDIMQGVAIIVAAKRKASNLLINEATAKSIHHFDLWGDRKSKYDQLWKSKIGSMNWEQAVCEAPNFHFQKTDAKRLAKYENLFQLRDLFSPYGDPAPAGVSTQDQFAISWSSSEVREKVESLIASNDEMQARQLYRLCSQDQWNYDRAKKALSNGNWISNIVPINYRQFDIRFTVYDQNVFVHRRERVSRHFMGQTNLGLVTCRQSAVDGWNHAFITSQFSDDCYLSNRTKERGYVFPLYLYPDEQDLDQSRRVNFDSKIRREIEDKAADKARGKPDEVAIFDYIYGVLHCPAYRETYKEFLKIDFPRVPYPPSPHVFWDVSAKGTQLRKLHLMEDAAVGATPYKFIGHGDSVVGKVSYEGGLVHINDTQGFEDVPEIAWNFHIGGYQPAQKWLKDRKTRVLSFDDIQHYQKIIKILSETDRIMKTITLPI